MTEKREKFQGLLAYFEKFTQDPLFRRDRDISKTPSTTPKKSKQPKQPKQPKTPKTPKSSKSKSAKNTPSKGCDKENTEEYAEPARCNTPDIHTIKKKEKENTPSLPTYDSDSSYSHATHRKRRQSFSSVRVHKKSARRMTFGSACDISPVLMHKHASMHPRPLSWTRGSATPTPIQIKRSLCAGEILQTEENFVSRLELLKKLYIIPLQVSMNDSDNVKLSTEEITSIFSNVEIILNVNRALLSELKELMHDWEDSKIVGDIFVKVIPFLKIYTDYVNNHQAALQAIDNLTAKNADFRMFVERTQTDKQCNGLLLRDFLIDPVQRIPRYELLLKELLKNTPDDHADHAAIETALEEVKNVATILNEKNREQKSRSRVIEIQKAFGAEFPELVLPHRILIEEGSLTLMSSKRPTTLFLFNDIHATYLPRYPPSPSIFFNYSLHLLVLAESTTDRKLKQIGSRNLETVWIVHHSTVCEEGDTGTFGYTYAADCLDPELGELVSKEVVFEILWPGNKHVFMCKSEEECEKWTTAISGAITDLIVKQPRTATARANYRLYRDPGGIWEITAPPVAQRITREQYEAQATTFTQQAIQDLINANALAIRSLSERKRRKKGLSGVLQRLTPHKSSKPSFSVHNDNTPSTPIRTPRVALSTPLPTTPQSPYMTPASSSSASTSTTTTTSKTPAKHSTPTRPLQPKNYLADPEPSPRPHKKPSLSSPSKDEEPTSPTSPRSHPRISHRTKSGSSPSSPASPRPSRRKTSIGGVQHTLKTPVSALSPRTPRVGNGSPTKTKTPKKVLFANVSP